MNRILITGGAGFIGLKLAESLLATGHTPILYDNLSPLIHGEHFKDSAAYLRLKNQFHLVEASILDQEQLSEAIDGSDGIIHLAAETGTGKSMYDIFHYTNVNANGTGLLWDLLGSKSHNVKKVVVASSRAVYGEGKYHCREHGIVYPYSRIETDLKRKDFHVKCPHCGSDVELLPTDENSKLHPISIYGITKQVQEQLSMLAGKSMKIPTVSLRYQNVYGPGQSLKNPYTGILSIFSSRLLNGNEINIFEDGLESRDFVFIDDIVEATLTCLFSEKADHQIYNVGVGKAVSVLHVAELLSQALEQEFKYQVSGNFRVGDIRHNFADTSKIKKQLGFEAKVSFEQGVAAFANWVKDQDVEEDRFAKSIREMRSKGLYH